MGLRDAALMEFGGAHVIFNNAGVAAGPTIGTPKAIWDWVLGVNVDGVINGINAFVPFFLEQNEGHVVNTASLAGLGGVPGMGAYCASKFAVVGISESLFHELMLAGTATWASRCSARASCARASTSRIATCPRELASYTEDPTAQLINQLAAEAVNAGIDPSVVADAGRGRGAHAPVLDPAPRTRRAAHDRAARRVDARGAAAGDQPERRDPGLA